MNQRPKKGMNVDSMYWMRNLNPLFMMHPFSFLFSFFFLLGKDTAVVNLRDPWFELLYTHLSVLGT